MKRLLAILVVVSLLLSGTAYGGKRGGITNEMIYAKLLEIEKRQAVLEAQFREFKESVDKRFEEVNKRFEQVDKRFEELRGDMNARFDQLYTFLWIITAIFTALVVAVIGFAYWDRRTIIRRAREETIEEVERLYEVSRLRELLKALRELAREDRRLAEVLRNFGLL
ncbi:hypothetical protein [Thermosulfurimonas sp.]|uniref:hypothetical protein n=1 Tax=Thermosulfurimonas sp. TaxID=2080236 RepID=UPI0025ED3E55|nr:hypothetical protein [Thermosulfurimonas sp.]